MIECADLKNYCSFFLINEIANVTQLCLMENMIGIQESPYSLGTQATRQCMPMHDSINSVILVGLLWEGSTALADSAYSSRLFSEALLPWCWLEKFFQDLIDRFLTQAINHHTTVKRIGVWVISVAKTEKLFLLRACLKHRSYVDQADHLIKILSLLKNESKNCIFFL